MSPYIILLVGIAVAAGTIYAFLRYRRGQLGTVRTTEDPGIDNEVLRLAFSRYPIGLGYVDSAGRWITANRKLLSTLGYTRAELFRTPLRLLTHPQDRKTEAPLLAELRSGKRHFYTIRKRVQRKSGDYGIYQVQMLRCGDETHPIFQCILDERVRHNTTLEHLAESIGEMSEAAIILCNGAGVIVGWSSGAERLFGFSESEMLGRAWVSLHTGPEAGRATALLASAARQGHTDATSTRVRRDLPPIEVKGRIVSDGRMRDTSGFLEVCRAAQPSGEESAAQKKQLEAAAGVLELAGLRDENALLRASAARAQAVEEELRAQIATMRTANGELTRRVRVLTEAVRKMLASRTKNRDSRHLGTGASTGIGTALPDLEWVPVTGNEISETVRRLAAEAKTGTLLLTGDGMEKRFAFHNGQLAACTSDREENLIGQVLVSTGVINEKECRAALEAHTVTGVPMGSSLVRMGLVTESDIRDVMFEKATRELSDAASHEWLRYAFVDGDWSGNGKIPVSIDPLAISGTARRFDDTAAVAERITAGPFIARKGARSRVYHRPDCGSARKIPDRKRTDFASAADAEAAEYRPCGRCLPVATVST